MTDTERMRAEFEAHALMSCEPTDLVRAEKGGYVWVWASESWALWQAACRAQAKRDAEICESLRHMPAYTRTDGLQITRSADARECAEAIKEGAGL